MKVNGTAVKYLHLYNILYGLDYCVIRLSNPYGMRQRVTGAQGAIAVFLDKVMKNEAIEIWGDGSVVRDYIFINDAVDAMINALDYAGNEHIFNVGSGAGRSLNEIIDEIESLIDYPVKRSYTIGRPLDVPVNVLDIQRADKYLCWKPKYTFSQGLKITLDWLSDFTQ